jgi:hypothetical protein
LISGLGKSFFDDLELIIQEEILDIIISRFQKLFIFPIAAGALAIALSIFSKRHKVVVSQRFGGQPNTYFTFTPWSPTVSLHRSVFYSTAGTLNGESQHKSNF